jgi:hypothetical protein
MRLFASAAIAAAMAIAAPAAATVHMLSFTGTVANTTTGSFTIGTDTYNVGRLILDPFTPFTLEQGDQILATISLDGAFFVPASGEQLFGFNFEGPNDSSPPGPNGSTNATGTVTFSLAGGPTARSGGDVAPGACSNCLTLITGAIPGAAFSFDGLGLDEQVTGLAAPFEVTQVSISYQNRDLLSAAPEPASWALMIGGMGFVGFAGRRTRATRTVLA